MEMKNSGDGHIQRNPDRPTDHGELGWNQQNMKKFPIGNNNLQMSIDKIHTRQGLVCQRYQG